MAAGNTALLSARRTRWARSRPTAVIAVLAAIALAAVTSMVGRELVSIQSLAADVQSEVLPRIMARQQRAIWTESLRSAANVVVYAPDQITRHQALAKAEQLAANVTYADIASRAVLDDAWASIRLAAGKADEAQRIDQQMRAMLSEADQLIGDMSANLSAIVDDPGATLDRAVKEATSVRDHSPWSRQTLEEVLAINVTSQELLASLDRGRNILSSALSLDTDRELSSAETHFVAIEAQLQARVDTLRGNSDYEYLPAMIKRFARLATVFGHQRTKLALQSEALAASASAKLRLGVVRENLAADAAGAAETSIANIAAGASRIKLTAAAMVVSLIMVVAVPLTRNWQTVMAGGRAEPQASAMQDAASPASKGAVAATVASLESLVKAQGNLEHWRRTLVATLSAAVSGALQQVALRATGAPAEQPVRGDRGDGHRADAGVLPEELAPCLTRMVGLIEDVAAQTGLAGLEASLERVRMIGGVRPDGDQPGGSDEGAMAADPACLPSDALVTAAVAADAVTICVGTTISEINAVATQEDRDLTQATADIMRMVAELNDQLAAIRDRDWQLPSTVG
jgi:hypothetical protein